ncbi:hypothetical protein [Paenibacillus koleovorans]|uniref:hypothetical protein n=1 Tax=Paenibacillus koleovorans TaxID=121608 RepID=UPI000FD9EBF5|nr:hypothetical protein [Paenibacillus koleovorans]
MPYFIGYKGKKLGQALSRPDAEEKLKQLSRCFNQLEIIQEANASDELQSTRIDQLSAAFIHPIYESTLYSERR